MGKPEEMETGTEENTASGAGNTKGTSGEGYGSGSWNSDNNSSYTSTRRRLYRNPDDKMLGGVIGGLSVYLGWDSTWFRLVLVFAHFWFQVLDPYLYHLLDSDSRSSYSS